MLQNLLNRSKPRQTCRWSASQAGTDEIVKEGGKVIDLKIVRKEKGYTQETLAEAACVHRSTIAMIEVGANLPSVNLAKKLGEILGFDWTLFFSN